MEKQTSAWKALKRTYYDMLAECSELSNKMYRKENVSDGLFMEKIRSRMELIYYKAEVMRLFVKTLKTAEGENISLGDEINDEMSCHYTIFISDLDLDIKNFYSHYFVNMECHDLFYRWQKLCSSYKEYFTETLELPKGIDLSTYYLANEIME